MIPNTDYVWLLGDSMIIKKGAISKILQIINKNKSDIIAFNTKIEILVLSQIVILIIMKFYQILVGI